MPNHLPKLHTSPYHHIGNKYQHVNLEGNITFIPILSVCYIFFFSLKLIVFEFCKSMLSFSLYSDHSLSFLAYLLVPLPLNVGINLRFCLRLHYGGSHPFCMLSRPRSSSLSKYLKLIISKAELRVFLPALSTYRWYHHSSSHPPWKPGNDSDSSLYPVIYQVLLVFPF